MHTWLKVICLYLESLTSNTLITLLVGARQTYGILFVSKNPSMAHRAEVKGRKCELITLMNFLPPEKAGKTWWNKLMAHETRWFVPSRVSGRGYTYKIGPICVCVCIWVCVCPLALSQLNRLKVFGQNTDKEGTAQEGRKCSGVFVLLFKWSPVHVHPK